MTGPETGPTAGPAAPSGPAGRRARLTEAAVREGLDAVLVTCTANVRYLTGFTGSAGMLLVPSDGVEPVLLTDGRYTEQAAREAPGLRCLETRHPAKAAAKLLRTGGAQRVGFESHHLTVAGHARLRQTLQEEGVSVRLEAWARPVEQLRRTKEPAEVARLREAAGVASSALESLLRRSGLVLGVTEADVARQLDDLMRRCGAEDRAFATIVAFGANAAEPHHRPTRRALQRGDLVKIDFGAVVDGYHSDMTRTFVLGRAQDWQRELHALVRQAQQKAVASVRAGRRASEVDAAARSVVDRAGHAEHFPHGVGHGVGLEVHEEPILGKDSAATLGDRYVVTVEPGVYLPGRGGVRIEDMVVVQPHGCELLTDAPRDLISL